MCFGSIVLWQSSVAICSSTYSRILPHLHSGVAPTPVITQHLTLPSPYSTYRALCIVSPSQLLCLSTHPTNSPSTLEEWGHKQKPMQGSL